MIFKLTRKWYTDESTIGELEYGSTKIYSLEDPVRSGPKQYGATAIPAGKYEVQITYSPAFRKFMPILIGVKGFTGIRIHSGNESLDTKGCILVGKTKKEDWIGSSREAYFGLYKWLENALDLGKVWIEITDTQKPVVQT